MILHTVVPFSCIFPEEKEGSAREAPPRSTDPADFLGPVIRPGEPLPPPEPPKKEA